MSPTSEKSPIVAAWRAIKPPVSLRGLRLAIGARPDGVILESVSPVADTQPSRGIRNAGRYSYFAFDAIETISIPGHIDPFVAMESRFRPWRHVRKSHIAGQHPQNDGPPFIGGWIGFISYDAGRFTEPRAGWTRQSEFPLAQWSLYDTLIVHDAQTDAWFIAGVEFPSGDITIHRPPLNERLNTFEALISAITEPNSRRSLSGNLATHLDWDDPLDHYLERVQQGLDYIRAGDIFQVNLARRMSIPVRDSSIELYNRLCRANPASYAAYIPIKHQPTGNTQHQPDSAVISSSPELFLSLNSNRVTTRPIKGTRPRVGDDVLDNIAQAELANSAKDMAELNMIIDLERNDLGRVCEFGTVRVLSDGEIEANPTVFHRTATIEGQLRADQDAIDLLRATFPGGSITGAPKVRAMQIINELEDFARGPYCGAIGYIGFDGDMQLNLAIRTMTVHDGIASLHVGSGIVADSTPEDEAAEIDAKAAGMLAAMGHERTAVTLGNTTHA